MANGPAASSTEPESFVIPIEPDPSTPLPAGSIEDTNDSASKQTLGLGPASSSMEPGPSAIPIDPRRSQEIQAINDPALQQKLEKELEDLELEEEAEEEERSAIAEDYVPIDPSPPQFQDMNDDRSQRMLIRFYDRVRDKANDHYKVAEYFNAYSNISAWARNLISVTITAVTTANVSTESFTSSAGESTDLPWIAAVLAALLTLVTFWGTWVKPEERAAKHFAASSR